MLGVEVTLSFCSKGLITVTRMVRTLLTTGAAIAALGGMAAAQSVAPKPSAQTRAMIMGPLVDELGPVPADSAVAAGFERETASPSYIDYESQRPGASRFARAGLSSQVTLPGVAPLSALQGRTATLAQNTTGRLSISLAGPGQSETVFSGVNPDYVEAGGMRLAGFDGDLPRNMALRYETSFDARGHGNGLDIGIAPRAGVSMGDYGPTYEAGATFRIGQYVREELEGRPAWWLFAGADREAVLYNPGQRLDMREAFAHRDYAMVGDAQAGVAARLYGAEISLAYVQRETSYAIPTHTWETKEDYAAFSLSWRR